MSPEQANLDRQNVDTRSDIFSLGTVLFELLCGEKAFANRSKSIGIVDILQNIMSSPTPRMSETFSSSDRRHQIAANRSESVEKVRHRLRGEIQWIVDRCLAKEPSLRYPTTNALTRDLQALLAGDVLVAAPESWRYRMKKWVGKNRIAAFLGVVVFACLLAGTIGFVVVQESLKQTRAANIEASKRFEQTKKAVDAFFVQVSDNDLLKQPRFAELRRSLLAKAVEYFEEFSQQSAADPRLANDRAQAEFRLGQIHAVLGDYAEAESHLDRAIEFASHNINVSSDPEQDRFLIARCFLERGSVHRLAKDNERALTDLTEAVKQFEVLAGMRNSESTLEAYAVSRELATGLSFLSLANRLGHDFSKALEEAERAVKIREEILAALPTSVQDRRKYANALGDLGNILHTLERPNDAAEKYLQANSIYQEIIASGQQTVVDQIGLARTNATLAGVFYGVMEIEKANTHETIAITHFEKCVEAEPSVVEYRENYARASRYQAQLKASINDDVAAEACLRVQQRELEILTQLAPNNMRFLKDLAKAKLEYGKFLAVRDRYPDALGAFGAAIPLYRQVLQKSPNDPYTKIYFGLCISRTREAYHKMGMEPQALEWTTKSEEWNGKLETEIPDLESRMQMIQMEDQYYAALFRPEGGPNDIPFSH